jgi:hypothetical protein
MNDADRVALVDRLARGLAWTRLEEHQRAKLRRRAVALVQELEIGREQTDRLGWMLLPEPVDAEAPDVG